MKIEIDEKSGYCGGVVYAITMAEDILETTDVLYCLGDIVHNEEEVRRLQEKGLIIVNHEEFKELREAKVLIRAHGEPPETYQIALKNNIELFDASCPVVLRLQRKIRKGYDEQTDEKEQIVIFGKEGHAEVNGLVGQTEGTAIVVKSKDDLEKVDFTRPIALYSQTTMGKAAFKELNEIITEKMRINGLEASYKSFDTICGEVAGRFPRLKKFAQSFDVIIFVSGKKSSNGLVLHEICKQENDASYIISGEHEMNPDWFKNAQSVGISGATSTPMWLMERIKKHIEKITSN